MGACRIVKERRVAIRLSRVGFDLPCDRRALFYPQNAGDELHVFDLDVVGSHLVRMERHRRISDRHGGCSCAHRHSWVLLGLGHLARRLVVALMEIGASLGCPFLKI